MDGYIGTILQLAYNWAPKSWALCNGALISVAQNTALFWLIGVTYGGNGTTTFALPDLQGRVGIGTGQGGGLSNYVIGQKAGSEQITLQVGQLPAHNHPGSFTSTSNLGVSVQAVTANGPNAAPTAGAYLAGVNAGPTQVKIYAPAVSGTPVALGGTSVTGNVSGNVTVGPTGNNLPVPILQPYLALTTVICCYGIYPSRP